MGTRPPSARAALVALGLFWPAIAQAQSAPVDEAQRQRIERELGEIKAMKQEMARQMGVLDARVDALEAELHGPAATPTPAPPATVATLPPPTQPATPSETATRSVGQVIGNVYEPGKGLVLVRSDFGELDFSAFTYFRYLNSENLNGSYTDSFGRQFDIDRREDLQFQKVMLYFKGWALDPKLSYLLYAWTSNTSQGQGAQVVLGGNIAYRFNEHLLLAAGIASLPTTRSTNLTFPNWLRVDNRTMADDFFRGSFTTGIWAQGEIVHGLNYRIMAGNNLSQLGVDASQLDNGLNTLSGSLTWMPTTGEFGPAQGFGDREYHEKLATLLAVHYTGSHEDAEAQAGVNDFENSQIRLSDGTRIFAPRAFGTDGQIKKATYRMLSLAAGAKYRGWSLDGEYYFRWVGDFETVGEIPVAHLRDEGFQLQASAMPIPGKLQIYASGSKIFGEYGNPYDVGLGANWYPFARRELKINAQALYTRRSAVGSTATPFTVGGTGWIFTTDVVLNF